MQRMARKYAHPVPVKYKYGYLYLTVIWVVSKENVCLFGVLKVMEVKWIICLSEWLSVSSFEFEKIVPVVVCNMKVFVMVSICQL